MGNHWLLTWIIFLPLVGMGAVLVVPRPWIRQTALAFALLAFLLSLGILPQFLGAARGRLRPGLPERLQARRSPALDSLRRFLHRLHGGRGRHWVSSGSADDPDLSAGLHRQLEDREEPARLFLPVPAAGERHARRLLGPGLLPLLCLLGIDAAADVFPDRHLGRAPPGIRRDQVLPLHPARQRPDADCDALVLLRQQLRGRPHLQPDRPEHARRAAGLRES